jgi:hypothetical protein
MSSARIYQSTVKVLPYPDLLRMTPALLSPIAAVAALIATWRLGFDAHWQVWLAMAIAIHWSAVRVGRLVKGG